MEQWDFHNVVGFTAFFQSISVWQPVTWQGDASFTSLNAGVKDAEKHRLLQTAATVLGSEVEAARIGAPIIIFYTLSHPLMVFCMCHSLQVPCELPSRTANLAKISTCATQHKRLQASAAGLLDAPKAAKKPHTVTAPHGKERVDEYYWLRDDSREDKEMMDYLQVKIRISVSLSRESLPWLVSLLEAHTF